MNLLFHSLIAPVIVLITYVLWRDTKLNCEKQVPVIVRVSSFVFGIPLIICPRTGRLCPTQEGLCEAEDN